MRFSFNGKFKRKVKQDIDKLSLALKNTQRKKTIDDLHLYILALEDRRYFRHHGVDFKAIIRELWKMLRGKKHGGASTINMQLVRTITNHRQASLNRKVYEIWLSIIIDRKFDKKDILNCYMENAYLGTGITGFKQAAERRYNKTWDCLENREKASLAAMLRYPLPRNPTEKWLEANKRRALYALKHGHIKE